MSARDLIFSLQGEGVILTLSPSGEINAKGNATAVKKCLPDIKANKSDIVAYLQCLEHEGVTSAVWYLEFPNRDPAEVHFTHDEAREAVAQIYPEAVAIVPVTPTIQQPDAPLSSDDEQKIRAWLADIGADDEETAETLDRCQQDAAAREYFAGRARVDADNI
ncbi:MAG: hypothetical protein LBU53_10700 [Zoogloeaceae bacterium]|jgi:hypothetical protein|nr:hypothetical protein [Zoogloeaceae bacterium]